MSQVIIVGGGLAGLSAAHTVLERGGRVLVLDKNAFMGGNSTKATSGINGALTRTQIQKGIQDSPEKFEEDTAISAAGGVKAPPSPLAHVLTFESGPAVDWLQSAFKLDLSLVSRLGGHSFPRTHRGKERFPGMTITYALMEKLEAIAAQNDGQARVITKARVTKLIRENGNAGPVIGVEYIKDGKAFSEYGPVIVATGGYGHDYSDDSLLKKYRPELMAFPTTNGDHCTGDGIKMALQIGADVVDMEWVQVHPTGLVHPDEPNAKLKFLAAEALRGVGALMLDKDGRRFVNELGRRDYVSNQMMSLNRGPYRLVMNGPGAKEIEWHCKHYVGRGLMKRLEGGEALAKEIGVSADAIRDTFEKYNRDATNQTDEFGKKYFTNTPFNFDDVFHVAIVCPVVHYCMGGLKISPAAEVMGANGAIPGLWATGEVCGGVHGKNRLGGSSLLDCVVFGRVSGAEASKYLLSQALSNGSGAGSKRLNAIAGQLVPNAPVALSFAQSGVQTVVSVDPSTKRITLETDWSNASDATPASAPVNASAALPSSSTAAAAGAASTGGGNGAAANGPKTFTMADVSKHNSEKDCWVVVNGQVLDVTNFLKDHPGGAKAILLFAGKDATAEFNMLHKPDVVQKYAPESILGTLSSGGAAPSAASGASQPASGKNGGSVSPNKTAGNLSHWSKDDNPMSLKAMPVTEASNTETRVSGGTAGILPAERARASFKVEKLTNFLDGGEERTARRKFILSPTEGLDLSDKYFWDREEYMREHMKHFIDAHNAFLPKFQPTRDDMSWMTDNTMLSGTLMNHFGLFVPTIMGQASDEQIGWWVQRARTLKIVGCYAQTELGHGSNVRGLQTIAEYDKNTQEFIINTPTLQSIKWWPGTLGKVSTHALVYAQLLLDGKEYGIHIFMVQIRDENHRPLPGIEVGDLGPKLGDGGNDTGFLRLDNLRIPREHMLCRYQQVSAEGQYIKSSRKTNDKMHYATMMFTRGAMVRGAGGALARAVTIATRYSAVRRQGFVDTSTKSYKAPERPILDYQVQRYRILKQLSLTYAIKFAGKWMTDRFKDLEGTEQASARIENTQALPEIAATSAGLKALCTYLAAQGIEDLRKCCGGAGYLLSSGIAQLAADYVWQTTAEGDWIILMLQTARFLLKSLNRARKGTQLSGPVEYLNALKQPGFTLEKAAPAASKSFEDFFNLEYLVHLYRHRALAAVVDVGEELQRRVMSGAKPDDAWNSVSVDLITTVRFHCLNFMLERFALAVKDCPDKPSARVLTRLCALFALTNIMDDQWAGFLTQAQMRQVKQATAKLLDELRPDAVALVDAFDIPDRVLNSTIGRYDGNVYEAQYEAAKKSDLNQRDPFLGYADVLRPRLDSALLQNGNKKIPVSKL